MTEIIHALVYYIHCSEDSSDIAQVIRHLRHRSEWCTGFPPEMFFREQNHKFLMKLRRGYWFRTQVPSGGNPGEWKHWHLSHRRAWVRPVPHVVEGDFLWQHGFSSEAPVSTYLCITLQIAQYCPQNQCPSWRSALVGPCVVKTLRVKLIQRFSTIFLLHMSWFVWLEVSEIVMSTYSLYFHSKFLHPHDTIECTTCYILT
jgi:hypothetical protein